MSNIDLDHPAGVSIRRHSTGMYVYMYKDKPGDYYNAHGRVVPDVIAKEAGFDTDLFGREKQKRERMRQAMSEIEMELALAKEGEAEILAEAADHSYQVIGLPLGRANVLDGDGNVLNTRGPIPREEAMLLFNKLVGEPDKSADEAAKPDKRTK